MVMSQRAWRSAQAVSSLGRAHWPRRKSSMAASSGATAQGILYDVGHPNYEIS